MTIKFSNAACTVRIIASAEAGTSLETLSAVLHPSNAIAAPALAMPQLREIAIDSFISSKTLIAEQDFQSSFFARRTLLDVSFEGRGTRGNHSPYRPHSLELVQFSVQISQISRTGSLDRKSTRLNSSHLGIS